MKRALSAIVSAVYPSNSPVLSYSQTEESGRKDGDGNRADGHDGVVGDGPSTSRKRRKVAHRDRRHTPALAGEAKVTAFPASLSGDRAARTATPVVTTTGSLLLDTIPSDVLGHCLSFVGRSADRRSLQTTCRTFRDVSNRRDMLRRLDLGGDHRSGLCGFVHDGDTRETALHRLSALVKSGNRQACHMAGIIKTFCYDDVSAGIRFLRMAAQFGYSRSSYVLGIILRDSNKEESKAALTRAAEEGFLPAEQELLTAQEMKDRYGEPSAEELAVFFDAVGLSRLLRRNYSQYPRDCNASHCWNPHCGRWAYKSGHTAGTSVDMSALLRDESGSTVALPRVARMKMCSSCRRAKYCSKLCQVYDWRCGRHKKECRRI